MGAQQSAPVVEEVGESTGPVPAKVSFDALHDVFASIIADLFGKLCASLSALSKAKHP